jgi:hypothetical protein
MDNNQLAQGDILLVPVSVAPAGFNPLPGRVVVGYGEASGHQHVMTGDCQWLVDALDEIELRRFANGEAVGQPVFVCAGDGVQLAHLDAADQPTIDHDAIAVPPGVYQVVRQRQWTAGMVRAVAD